MSLFLNEVDLLVKKGKLPSFVADILKNFHSSYIEAVKKNGYSQEIAEPCLLELLHYTAKQIAHPYRFEPYHKKIRKPDYYRFGLDFIRPLIDLNKSKIEGQHNVYLIQKQINRGENVILFANHQIEPDPQVISILLEPKYPELAEDMIFVAGHRVITDPLAVPMSLGRNLICIYSKKYIEHPPEQKAEKLIHNQQTMKKLAQLLHEGGKCIYVAPSGGRDRPDDKGQIRPAPFDSQSIEMFLLMAKAAKTPTHFYPLTLSTYHILPPPNTVEKEIGEKRKANCAPVFLHFNDEVDPYGPFNHIEDKNIKRKQRADYIWNIVVQSYLAFEKTMEKS